jgi:hypothetical protein
MDYQYNDGGRQEAGFKGDTRDCFVRAVAIATERPYKKVYDFVNRVCKEEKASKTRRGKSCSRTGVHSVTARKIMEMLGWAWTPTMIVGQGCKVHLRADELPQGRVICRVSKHFVAVIDGVAQDTFDPTRQGKRCVYGYWVKEA